MATRREIFNTLVAEYGRFEYALEQYSDDYNGICTACGSMQYGGVEPDARGYHCENCEENKIAGVENLIFADLTVFEVLADINEGLAVTREQMDEYVENKKRQLELF